MKISLKVGIFVGNLANAKLLSSELRQLGIMAHIFTEDQQIDLSSSKKYDLLIVDPDIIRVYPLGDNPLLVLGDEKINQANIIGSIPHEEFSSYSLKFVIKQLHQTKLLEQRLSQREQQLKELQNKNALLERDSIFNYEKVNSYELLNDLLEKIDFSQDYLKSISRELGQWDQCYSFSIYVYDKSSRRFLSMDCQDKKFVALPSMTMKDSDLGEDMLAMFEEAFLEEFETSPRVFKLSSRYDAILIGSFSPSIKSHKAWSYFSNAICVKSLEHGFNQAEDSGSFIELMENLDRDFYNIEKLRFRYLTLNFQAFNEFIATKQNSRFYWKSFYYSFFKSLEALGFKVYKDSLHAFVIESAPLELKENYDKVKALVKGFDYWKFFENKDVVIKAQNLPSLSLTPLSSSGYIRAADTKLKVNLSKNHLINH